jgi:N-acyl-D-aspartate/D-glutamate deacylase
MAYDILIKGGRIYDGSGLPSYLGDVAVKDGRIVETGRISGSAARVVNADGLAVSPGFIDFHTHLDAQLLSRRDHRYPRQLRLVVGAV